MLIHQAYYTANLFLPLFLRLEITCLPFLVFLRTKKPCVLFLFLFLGL